jgi:hypothetical protein
MVSLKRVFTSGGRTVGDIPNKRVDEVAEAMREFLHQIAKDMAYSQEPDRDVILAYASIKAGVSIMFDWQPDDCVVIFQAVVNAAAAMINRECEERGRLDRVEISMKVFQDMLPPGAKAN